MNGYVASPPPTAEPNRSRDDDARQAITMIISWRRRLPLFPSSLMESRWRIKGPVDQVEERFTERWRCGDPSAGVGEGNHPPTLVHALIDQPFAAWVVLTVVAMAPTGVILGMAMPMGWGRFSRLYPGGIPYEWGVNGIASVLASVLGIAIALNFGYVVASLVAAASYMVVAEDADDSSPAPETEVAPAGV